MNGQNRNKVAIYIRVSTEEQAIEGQSAQAQEGILKQYCSAYNMEIYDVYTDLGISGKSLKDREGLKRLIEDCSKKKFDLVLVWKISRLSRNLKDLLYVIDILESNNVYFASCSEKFDTATPVGRMTLQLLGSIAEFERNTIIENVRLGLAEFARKGGKASSVLGYDNIEKKLSINKKEADIVRLVFSLYIDNGLNYSAIASHLNNIGCKTKRGSKYRSSSISYIINNPVYIGINRHKIKTEKEYQIRSAHPAIITEDLWNRAQDLSNKHQKKKAGTPSDSISFIVYCMKCNSVLKIFYTVSKGKKYKYLRCCRCSNYVNVEKLEEKVSQAITAVFDDKTLHKTAFSIINRNNSIPDNKGSRLTSIESQLSRLQKLKSHYFNLFEEYKIKDNKLFTERINEIELQINKLEKRKSEQSRSEEATDEENYDAYFSGLKGSISALEPVILKQICSRLIKYIKAYKDQVDIVLYF
ncbi:MAG TPA: recombinase family protein [Bacillota bacterium]|nr:recombinase family protein [Bacillota bacterium]